MLQPHAINLLKRLGERVVEHHEEYNQSNWGEGNHQCHTNCCFGGHLCLMVDGVIPEPAAYGFVHEAPCFKRAVQILGIDTQQGLSLFNDFYPNFGFYLREIGYHRPGSLEYAQRAQKFLNEWIEKETRA